jgi:hypothetical protein
LARPSIGTDKGAGHGAGMGMRMEDYQMLLAEHTRKTLLDRQQGAAQGSQSRQTKDVRLLGEVQALSMTVNEFIRDFPRRVYIKRGVSHRRLALAILIYLAALGYNLKFFYVHYLFSREQCVEIARIIFKTAPDYAQYGDYVYLGFVLLLSLLSLSSAFMVVMVVCLILSILQFKWVNSVFEALATAAGSAVFMYFYLEYLSQMQTQIAKVLA